MVNASLDVWPLPFSLQKFQASEANLRLHPFNRDAREGDSQRRFGERWLALVQCNRITSTTSIWSFEQSLTPSRFTVIALNLLTIVKMHITNSAQCLHVPLFMISNLHSDRRTMVLTSQSYSSGQRIPIMILWGRQISSSIVLGVCA